MKDLLLKLQRTIEKMSDRIDEFWQEQDKIYYANPDGFHNRCIWISLGIFFVIVCVPLMVSWIKGA